MAQARDDKWVLRTLVFDYAGGQPGFTDEGHVAGQPKDADIKQLVQALAKLGEATGRALDKVQVPPSQFTLEGHIAIQVAAGLPTVVTFGVEAGISVSMTWDFEKTETVIKPLGVRKT